VSRGVLCAAILLIEKQPGILFLVSVGKRSLASLKLRVESFNKSVINVTLGSKTFIVKKLTKKKRANQTKRDVIIAKQETKKHTSLLFVKYYYILRNKKIYI